MSDVEIRSRRELVTDAIRRIVAYTDLLRWFGPNSVGGAFADALGGQTSLAYRLYKAVLRRLTLRAAEGDILTQVAAERGATRRSEQRSRVLVVFLPFSSNVTAITVGLTTAIEVESSEHFEADDSIRIVNADGSLTERLRVISIGVGTGPTGRDELVVASLANTYDVTNDPPRVVLRHTVGTLTELTTASGIVIATVERFSIGDFNPVLAGESTNLALVDKVWCEAKEEGTSGNIAPRDVTGLVVADDKVSSVYNPERGFGGGDEEADEDLRYRTAHQFTRRSRDTASWLEAICVEADHGVLRAVQLEADEVATFRIAVVARNGGPLSERRRASTEAYVQERVRGPITISVENAELTSVEIEFRCHLAPDTTLREAWLGASEAVVAYVDYRKWAWGTDVDHLELLRRCRNTSGIRSIEEDTFEPSQDVDVEDTSLPVVVRVSVMDLDTGETINAELATSFDSSLLVTV